MDQIKKNIEMILLKIYIICTSLLFLCQQRNKMFNNIIEYKIIIFFFLLLIYLNFWLVMINYYILFDVKIIVFARLKLLMEKFT